MFVLDDPIVRSLVTESSNIFYNLQTAKNKTNDIYLRSSRAYRSAIRTTLNKLQEAASEDIVDQEDVRKYESFITIFYCIECLWHLCEFLLIDHSTLSVVPNLLEWVRNLHIRREPVADFCFSSIFRQNFIFLRQVSTQLKFLSTWIAM